MYNCSCGGVAYLEVLDTVGDYYKPALVFFDKLGSGYEKYVAEAISHEVGPPTVTAPHIRNISVTPHLSDPTPSIHTLRRNMPKAHTTHAPFHSVTASACYVCITTWSWSGCLALVRPVILSVCTTTAPARLGITRDMAAGPRAGHPSWA